MPWPDFEFPSDAAWEELPGGPMATNEATGATWRLLVTNTATDPYHHLFMHPAHPDFQGYCAVAHVDDRGDAAELGRLRRPGAPGSTSTICSWRS